MLVAMVGPFPLQPEMFGCGDAIVGASIMDIAPTILYLAGVPIPANMGGQVLNLFSDDRLKNALPSMTSSTNNPATGRLHLHTRRGKTDGGTIAQPWLPLARSI